MEPLQSLRIVVVAPGTLPGDTADDAEHSEAARSRVLHMGLLQSGYNIVAVLPADVFLPDRLAQIMPDLIVVDADSQARDTLEHVVIATRDARRPIVLFTEDDDTSHVPAAIAAGVSAYVVAGLAPARIKPVLDVALARFQHDEALRNELASARSALNELNERKIVDRAKGVLMGRHAISESEAYVRLRQTAVDKKLTVAEVAQRLVDVADLLV